jgi:hypothetical protein
MESLVATASTGGKEAAASTSQKQGAHLLQIAHTLKSDRSLLAKSKQLCNN